MEWLVERALEMIVTSFKKVCFPSVAFLSTKGDGSQELIISIDKSIQHW